MNFKLISDYSPSGDQPSAIDGICRALKEGSEAVTLLGVTGSGKTFTMANVIERLQRPALILSHNKTLAAQLYGEFKAFFPNNAVEYFVSYYDYYQPEAYIPTTDTYIEKDLSINDEIEKLRLSAASALMSGRRDVIVISSVSCLYGIGNPEDFHNQTVVVRKGEQRSLTGLLYKLVDALYSRTETDFKRGTFRVRGDTVDVCIGYGENAVRCHDILTAIPEIKGIFDPANFIQSNQETLEAWELLKPHIQYLHVKDALADGSVVPAGKGIGNLAHIVREYLNMGGTSFTIEPHLKVFSGLASLEQDGHRTLPGVYEYESNRIAFDAACAAFREVLAD